MKTVVMFGAGASYAEAKGNPDIFAFNLPPLDKDFLQKINSRAFEESGCRIKFDDIDKYLKNNFGIDVLKNNYSLEFIYNLIYNEAIAEQNDRTTVNRLLQSLTIIIRDVIKHTTNIPNCNNPLAIRGLLSYLVKDYPKNDLDIITFNYDLLVERTLDKIQGDVEESVLFNIEKCYPTIFKDKIIDTQIIKDPFSTYQKGESIKICKLHGSINWFIEEDPNKKITKLTEDSSNFYLIKDKLIFDNIDYNDIAINKK